MVNNVRALAAGDRNSVNCLKRHVLVNSSEALWQLKLIYFNPFSDHNPVSVSLSVEVTVDNVITDQCSSGGGAFINCSRYNYI